MPPKRGVPQPGEEPAAGVFGKEKQPKLQQGIRGFLVEKSVKGLPRGALSDARADTPEQAAFFRNVASDMRKQEEQKEVAAESSQPQKRSVPSPAFKSFAAALVFHQGAANLALKKLDRLQRIYTENRQAIAERRPLLAMARDSQFLTLLSQEAGGVRLPKPDEMPETLPKERALQDWRRQLVKARKAGGTSVRLGDLAKGRGRRSELPAVVEEAVMNYFTKAAKHGLPVDIMTTSVAVKRALVDQGLSSLLKENGGKINPESRERSVEWLSKIWEDIDENRGPMVQGCWRKTGFYNAVWPGTAAANAETPEPAAETEPAEPEDEDDVSDTGLSDIQEFAEAEADAAESSDESDKDSMDDDEAESGEDGFGNEDV
eukprot:tig00000658_g2902.t1